MVWHAKLLYTEMTDSRLMMHPIARQYRALDNWLAMTNIKLTETHIKLIMQLNLTIH